MKYVVIAVVCSLALFCRKSPEMEKNIFLDEVLQKIYTLQDERDSEPLLALLKENNPHYRRAAALTLASVQEKSAVGPLTALLSDGNEEVRAAAAYSLGQIRDKSAEPRLMEAFEKEKSALVKRDILEALGKCGTPKGLEFITGMKFRNRDKLLLTGQARGIYRFARQNITSTRGTEKAAALLAPVLPEDAVFWASHYLARGRGVDLTPYYRELIEAFNREDNLFTRMNLVLAMGKAKEKKISEFLRGLLSSHRDYRIKVNALRALRNFDYNPVKHVVLELPADPDVNVSVSAAQYIQAKGVSEDASLYLEKAVGLTNWRSRSLMLGAALKFSPDNKKAVSQTIISAYQDSQNIYEKGALLQALGTYPDAYKYAAAQVFSKNHLVVKSYGIAALITMRRHRDFPVDDRGLQAKFAEIFKKAIESGDIALIGQAAEILRDPEMNFKTLYKSSAFLNQALQKLDLPGDIEAYQQLRQTIIFFQGDKAKFPVPAKSENPVNWELVNSIKPGQEVKISTTKGNITIKLLVNESPGSAANFIRLINSGFYLGGSFHRVEPNFVIQAGCPRGDGWGGPDFSIRSEFAPLYYQEGSVGMASAGKDTESSQWFITHSPTPHLDGRYTIFGKVISGMDVVHRIEIGDKIISLILEF